eukprot:403338280
MTKFRIKRLKLSQKSNQQLIKAKINLKLNQVNKHYRLNAHQQSKKKEIRQQAQLSRTQAKRNQKMLKDHLKKLEEKKYQDNSLKELERKRFQEAKIRLRNYVIYHSIPSASLIQNYSTIPDYDYEEERQLERVRLLNYFKHRYFTFIQIMKDSIRARKVQSKSSNVEIPFLGRQSSTINHEEQKKIFSLASQGQQKIQSVQNLTAKQAQEAAEEEIQKYLRNNNLASDTKLFTICGHYDDVRQELLRRGWVEHVRQADEKFNSLAFHFLYATKSKDIFRIHNISSIQHTNHFEGAKSLTTKVGLTHNMKNLVLKHNIDIDSSFPQSFDLSDLTGDEVKDWKEDFKYCQVISYLKQAINFNKQSLAKNIDKIVIAISICEQRLKANNDSIFQITEWGEENKPISDDIHEIMSDMKLLPNFGTQPWFRKLQKQYKEINEENAKATIKQLLEQVSQLHGRQYHLIGNKNAWILKPGGKSRGRGITIHNKIESILQAVQSSSDSIWVIMKYIENPLIIHNKKFDIRQWVVVTSWDKLKIWYFDECYLRFTSDDYDPNRLHDKFMHLTNNCVASQSENFNNSVIEGNMWDSTSFRDHLCSQYSNIDEDIYKNRLQPQIKQGVIASMLAARAMVIHKENTHEMFGYDFMVDTDFNVWLIEVNSSPSMEHSTKVTQRLVKSILTEIPHLVIDCQNGTRFSDEMHQKCGKFELIFSEE